LPFIGAKSLTTHGNAAQIASQVLTLVSFGGDFLLNIILKKITKMAGIEGKL